jgi:dienelactone hydrolase
MAKILEMRAMKRFTSLFASTCFLIAWSCAQAADSRTDFLQLIARPSVPLAAVAEEASRTNGIVQIHFSFGADASQRVPGWLLKAEGSTGRQPVVISMHGTGGNKRDMLPLARKLVEKGFIAVAIDGRYHGERTKAGKGAAEYNDAIVRAWHKSGEHPFYYDTVWDIMRLIDYLETREDVDPKRIGLIGFSKGGIETYLAAAVDKRVAVAVPCIGVQSFGWALENKAWKPRIGTIQASFSRIAEEEKITEPDEKLVRRFYDQVAPGIYSRFDGPAMLPLIAPRPLLVINGDSDDRTPLPGLRECTDAAGKAYHSMQADEAFLVRIQEKTGHKVTPESETFAIEWFVRWLKP